MLNKISVTKTCCLVWNIQKYSLESPVIQLQQLITQFTKEFNSKTDEERHNTTKQKQK